MKKPLLIYCYDAYCGWCYGFSKVIQQLIHQHADKIEVEILSGGMILPTEPTHISASADYILNAYPNVEALTQIKFGEDYLWHLKNADKSDWFPHSEKPAIALSIIKDLKPHIMIDFVSDMQFGLFSEGRDLTDDEAYRHLLHRYEIEPSEFYNLLHSDTYKQKAHYDFALCKQLQVNGFPSVFIQKSSEQFYLIARGYTDYSSLENRLLNVISN